MKLQTLIKSVRHSTKWFVGQILPPTCIACDTLLPVQEPVGICSTCFSTLPWWDASHPATPDLPNRINSFRAPFLYEPPLDQLIPRFKYADATGLIAPLARTLATYVPTDSDLLIPVPLHTSRLRQRKYNQAAELAKMLSKIKGIQTCLNALERTRRTASQAGQNRSTRQKQLSGAFRANPSIVQGKNICLIDDVYTTGSTVEACAIALHKAGAARIDVVTLCYVAPKL